MAGEEIISQLLSAGLIGVILGLGMFLILIVAAFYVYYALVWQTIAKKLRHNYPWLAWIPFAGTSLRLQLGGFHWAWVFLYLVPIFGWIALGILGIISTWRVFEKREYPGWLSLAVLFAMIPYIGVVFSIGYLIILGFVAWKDN